MRSHKAWGSRLCTGTALLMSTEVAAISGARLVVHGGAMTAGMHCGNNSHIQDGRNDLVAQHAESGVSHPPERYKSPNICKASLAHTTLCHRYPINEAHAATAVSRPPNTHTESQQIVPVASNPSITENSPEYQRQYVFKHKTQRHKQTSRPAGAAPNGTTTFSGVPESQQQQCQQHTTVPHGQRAAERVGYWL